jgi:hypothetical protein
MRAPGVHIHERHQLRRHDDEGAHHVVVFVLEDVAVVHVTPAEDLEADEDGIGGHANTNADIAATARAALACQ